jgi:hypothetical protein
MSFINDVREIQEFKSISFSNCKISAIKKELISCINNYKIENLCHWTCDLICSGHFIELWELIVLYSSKYIHTANIKLFLYLSLRLSKFKEIINNGYIGNELKLRNNELIRQLFLEILCVLSYSNRKYEIQRLKLSKDELLVENFRPKFKADSLNYAALIYKHDDPKDLFISINELIYHMKVTKNINSICYWIEWILLYENKCKKNKQKCVATKREYDVEDKYKTDIIWVVWDAVKYFIDKRDVIYVKCFDALLNLFTLKYSNATKRKRIFILYMLPSLVTENINMNVAIINNKNKIDTIIKNNDKVFKQMKKHEVVKKGGGLTSNTGKYNDGYLENSIRKLQIINNM